MHHSEYGDADAKGTKMNYQRLKKIFSNLREANSTFSAPDNGPSLTDGSVAAFKVEDPEVLARINAFLKVFCTERHQDPKYALVVLRTKLNTLGLDFSYDGRRPLSPNETFHLTQFGGRTGVDEKGNQLNDCGISHRTGGRSMELSVQISPLNVGTDAKEPGPYYISAKIQFAEGMNKGDTSPIEKGEAANSIEVKEEKDECYKKVKARYDVFPSAYASGALVKCRKVGADNWGNKSKKD